jgi:hypothetical protein
MRRFEEQLAFFRSISYAIRCVSPASPPASISLLSSGPCASARMTTNPYKRRRWMWSLILFATSCLFMIYLRLESVSTQLNQWKLPLRPQRPQIITQVDDFKALLYMLTETDDELPEDFDVKATPLDLRIFASGARWTTMEWNKRVQTTDRFNPLIVFSKVSEPFFSGYLSHNDLDLLPVRIADPWPLTR